MNVKLRNDEKVRVLNGVDLYEVMQKILKRSSKIDQKKEHFWVVGLDVTHEILFIELIGLGTSKMVNIDPKEIFFLALRKDAFQVVLVHNHPSGNLRPSEADEQLTHRMIYVGKYVNLPIWDHLIITDKSYYSFLDSGLLDKLEADNTKIPDVILESILKTERDMAEKQLSLTTAKFIIHLHKNGSNLEVIKEIAEMDEKEIKKVIEEYEAGEYNE